MREFCIDVIINFKGTQMARPIQGGPLSMQHKTAHTSAAKKQKQTKNVQKIDQIDGNKAANKTRSSSLWITFHMEKIP